MPRKAEPSTPRRGSLDMLMSRNSAVRARLGNDENVSVDYIEACGALPGRSGADGATPSPAEIGLLRA